MAKALTDKEINQAMEKIKKKHEEYALKYSRELFSYESFKKRYLDFLKTKGVIDVFLFAEIQALEDKKNEIEDKIAKRKRVKEAGDVLTKKEEEIFQMIAGYPEDLFHDDARIEIRKLMATLKILSDNLNRFSYDISNENRHAYQHAQTILKDFMIQPFSGLFSKYYRELSSPIKKPSEIEVLEQQVIKEWGTALSTFIFVLSKVKNNEEIKDFIDILKTVQDDFRLTIFNPLI
ncbi:MAG TPA: hypothetical protein DHW82_14300 [Spirochaetia bacterium]|nr:MAG: hypothetical protein A2Y41_12170 [Spirochaetes bacterium GWB1_36_13]HCL58162.1 hypothetical protein [Spirochaetia bacterium]